MQFLEQLKVNLNEMARHNFINEITKIDQEFYENVQERRKNYLIARGFIWKKMWTEFGILEVKVRKYFDKVKKEYVYPIYQILGLDKRSKFNNNLKNSIVKDAISNVLSYEKVVKSRNIFVSKTTVFRWVQKLKIDNNVEFKINDLDKHDKIFICIDDTYRNMIFKKKKSKFRFRIINFYQNKVNNKFINQYKLTIIYKCNNKENTTQLYKQILKILNEKYGFSKLKQQIIICGDGAKFISKLAKKFKKSISILDKFHCLQSIQKVFNFRNNTRALVNQEAIRFNKLKQKIYFKLKEFLLQNDFKNLQKLLSESIDIFYKNYVKQRDVIKLKRYISNHQDEIINWKLFDFNPCYTECYVQQIVKSSFGNVGKIYSITTFSKIISFKSDVILAY